MIVCCKSNKRGEKLKKIKNLEQYNELLITLPIFDKILKDEIFTLLNCLRSEIKVYNSEEIVTEVDDEIEKIGVVLKGQIYIAREDYYGNRNIISELGVGEIFGENYITAGIKKSPISVISEKETEILFIEYKKIINNCGSSCNFHGRIVQNMLKLIARRNLLLNEKIEILGKRSIRDKINFYLLKKLEKQEKDKTEIVLDFSRQELADYLCVDRSAMTRELSKMQKDGFILIEKRKIKILKKITNED